MKHLDKTKERKYLFSDYDPNWVTKFDSLKGFVERVFGDKVMQIEHVGSTSIPGMKSKPIIDMLVIVKDVKDLSKETDDMVKAGYEWGENYIAPDTLIYFNVGRDGEKLENIHVCKEDSPKVKQFIVMRDFLRAFPDKAKEYSDLKEINFKKYPDSYIAYRNAKTAFLDEIQKEAYEWEGKSKML